MVEAEREISFLPAKESLAVQTSQFAEMKKALTKVTAKAKVEEDKKPSLFGTETGCSPTRKLEYEPGQDIETICASTKK
jgi:hypothetical protein